MDTDLSAELDALAAHHLFAYQTVADTVARRLAGDTDAVVTLDHTGPCEDGVEEGDACGAEMDEHCTPHCSLGCQSRLATVTVVAPVETYPADEPE